MSEDSALTRLHAAILRVRKLAPSLPDAVAFLQKYDGKREEQNAGFLNDGNLADGAAWLATYEAKAKLCRATVEEWDALCVALTSHTPTVAADAERERIDSAELLRFARDPLEGDWQAAMAVVERARVKLSVIEQTTGTNGQSAKSAKQGGNVTGAQIESLLGQESKEVLIIARSDKSADEKMREICGIDKRYVGWDSSKWGSLLGVSAPAIRKTEFWKVDRDRANQAVRDMQDD